MKPLGHDLCGPQLAGLIKRTDYIKYESSGPCGFSKWFHIFPFVRLWEVMTPRGGACMDPRVTVGRIYRGVLYYTVLHIKCSEQN